MGSVTRAADGRLSISGGSWVRATSWPAGLLLIVSHVEWGDPGFPPVTLYCAGVLCAIALVSTAYAVPRVLPVLPIILVRYYFAMGFPVFYPPRVYGSNALPIRISSGALERAAIAGVLFAAMLLLGFFVAKLLARRVAGDVASFLDRRGKYDANDTLVCRCIAGISIILFVVVCISPSGQAIFGSFSYVFAQLGTPAISLGLLFWDAERTQSQTSRMAFWAGLGVLCCGGLLQGMIGSVLEPLLATAIYSWTIRGRLPVVFVVISVVVLMILNPAKHAYRGLSWHQNRDVSLLERAGNWGVAIERTYGSSRADAVESSTGTTASRLATLMFVAHMFEWVPLRVPYAGPKAWLELPLEFVPRVFWPNKPQHAVEFNNRYTLTFGLQTHQMTKGTTMQLPSVGDGYWRIGWWGVVIEGLLLGTLVGGFEGLAGAGSPALTITGAGFASRTGPEGHVLGTLSGTPQYLFVMFVLLVLAQALPVVVAGARKTKLAGPARAPMKVR